MFVELHLDFLLPNPLSTTGFLTQVDCASAGGTKTTQQNGLNFPTHSGITEEASKPQDLPLVGLGMAWGRKYDLGFVRPAVAFSEVRR